MNAIRTLAKRNAKLFLRDRSTLFFSFLSSLILLALYFLFIAKIYAQEMEALALPFSAAGANFIIYLQMMAGVLILNSMSLATGAFSTIAKDFENKRTDCFLLAPIRAWELAAAYFCNALAVSFGLNTLTWSATFALIGALTGYWLSAATFFSALAVLFFASLISCSIMLLVTSLVKSSAAIGVIAGISGTFFGFLCGIYMPYNNLGEGTKAAGSLLPLSHLTIWLKRLVLRDAFAQLELPAARADDLLLDYFSAESIGFCTLPAPLWLMLLLSGLLGAACLLAARVVLGKRMNR
ncbi:MAG: ABC transporter permease [Oscillospiraceae bacterium]|jgi:multidrug/hemolysin transport system permease protein|nr:ABC transporter permease [Oscillospiraceae bacterium]